MRYALQNVKGVIVANYNQLSLALGVTVLDGAHVVHQFATVYDALRWVYDTQTPPQVQFAEQLAYMVHYFVCMGYTVQLGYNS